MKNFLFSFCMLVSVVANAQTGVYGCKFTNPQVLDVGGVAKFRFVINMVAEVPFNLGSTNFRYNINQNALANPVIVANAFPTTAGFGLSTTTGTSATTGVQSINTVYNGAPDMSPVAVLGLTPVPLITMEYDITNSALTTDLVFRQITAGNPRTTALDDNKTVTLIQSAPLFMSLLAVPLPIELISFTAVEKGATNEILWETATEENVRIFVVERSLNGSDWTKLGETEPNNAKRYSMSDRNPAKTTYYRLRNIDNDGQTEVSQMVVVNRKNKDSKGIKFVASPNPVADVVKITFDNGVKGSVTTNIINVAGQVVHTQFTAALSKDAEVTTYDVNMSDLPAGTYFFQVSSDTDEFVQTIVKQ
jgi:hypothetical protein